MLLMIAFFWGFTTVLMQVVNNYMGWQMYLFLRFASAALVLMPFMPRIVGECWRTNRRVLLHGAMVGIMIYIQVAGNVIGMKYTTVSNCSFIAQLSIVLVPLMEIIAGKERPKLYIAGGIGVTLAGLVFLTGLFKLELNIGDLIVFGVALMSSIDMIYVGRCAERGEDMRAIGTLQIVAAAAASGVGLLLTNDYAVTVTPYSVFIVLLTGIVGSTVCKVVMAMAQKYVSPQQVSFDLSLMPVFGVIGAMVIPGASGETEKLIWNDYIGCVLILIGFFIILYYRYREAGKEIAAAKQE